jgi:hypothetical protein
MSNALKNAAETTVHAFSDLVEDLVEGARDRIEDLPPLAKSRRARRGFPWPLVVVALAIAAVVVGMKRMRRGSTSPTSTRDDSTAAKIGERTLAVS